MSKLGRFLLFAAVILVGVGFYRGWFAVTSGREAGSHTIDVKFSVDPDKVQADTEQVTPSK